MEYKKNIPNTIFTGLEYPEENLYDNGLPFNDAIANNIDDAKIRVLDKNMPAMILIDGVPGSGKTNLGVNALIYAQQKMIEWEYQYACGGNDFQEKLAISYEKKLHVIIYDELGDLNKRGALSTFNKVLIQTFETFRTYKILVIGILPRIDYLENSIFDLQLPRGLLHCTDKKQKSGYNDGKGYSLHRMNLIRERMEKLGKRKYQAYKQITPNFLFHSKVLPPNMDKKVTELATKYKKKVLSHGIMKAKGLLTYKDIKIKLGVSEDWVRRAVFTYKLKPEYIHKRKNYFSPDIISILEPQIKYKIRKGFMK